MSKPNKPRITGRRLLVDSFHLRLVGAATFHFVLVALIFTGAVFAPVVIQLESDDITQPNVQAAAREYLTLNSHLWMPLLAAFVLLALHNVLVTHRIAGPLFRLRDYLRAVGDGDLSSPIRIRKRDYLHKEAEAASAMVRSLREKIDQMDSQLHQTTEVWLDLKNALANTVGGELRQKLNAVDIRLEACRTSVKNLVTGRESAHARQREELPEPVGLDT